MTTDAAADYDRRIEDLRAFEREYRARMRAYLLSQLARLDEPAVEGDPLCRQIRQAISDPGKIADRKHDLGIDGGAHESLPNWQARAVMAVIQPYLKEG